MDQKNTKTPQAAGDQTAKAEGNAVTKDSSRRKILLFAAIGAALVLLAALIAGIVTFGDSDKKLQEQLDLGTKYLEEMDYDQALVAFNTALSIDPKNVDAYLGIVEVYTRTNDFESVLQYAKKGYEATGDERLKEKIDLLEGEDGNTQGGDGQNTSDAENVPGTEAISDEQVQISLKEFLTSPTVAGTSWMDCKLADIMEFYGVNADNTSVDLSYSPDEYTFEDEAVSYWLETNAFSREEVAHTIGQGDSGVWYTAMHAGESDEIGVVEYNLCLEDDPENPYYITDRLKANLEMFSGYLLAHECESVADLLVAWGMEEADPSMVEAARNHQNYTGTYTTEYGNLDFVLEYSEPTFSGRIPGAEEWVEWLLPQLELTVEFDQESTPFQTLTVTTKYQQDSQTLTSENPNLGPYAGNYEPDTLVISVTRSGYVE